MIAEALLCFLSQASDLKTEARTKLAKNPLDPQIGQLLQRAVSTDSSDPEAHYLLGQWAILNHQEDLAIREEQKAIERSRGNNLALMQAYTLIGIAEDTLNEEKKAREAFEQAKVANGRLTKPDGRALYEYAAFLFKHAKPSEALQVTDKVLAIAPDLSEAHLLKAKLLERAGDRAAALAEAESAAAKAEDPGEERAARAFLARAYFADGQTEKANFNQKWIEEHH